MSLVDDLKSQLEVANARILDLEASLHQNDDTLGVAFGLSTAQSNLLGCLLSTPNVTPKMISLRLGIASDAKVAVHRLRSTLKEFSASRHIEPAIDIQSRRGLGYWLTSEDKVRIKAITSAVTASS